MPEHEIEWVHCEWGLEPELQLVDEGEYHLVFRADPKSIGIGIVGTHIELTALLARAEKIVRNAR